jgi:ACS family glucarate transporter-like MFS transporter
VRFCAAFPGGAPQRGSTIQLVEFLVSLWDKTACHPGDEPTRYRHRVLGLLSLLLVITYLDRVCLAIAGPRMQEALHIGPVAWGWVTGVFTIAYASFEIPSGALGDRLGPRRVLTRIVLWWSAFTSLTGIVSNYYLLLLTRFCFGMGEAGAYPNAGVVISRWSPPAKRTSAWGIAMMAGQLGGAFAPLLVVPIQMRYGWRASFYMFGLLGVAWAVVWYRWFRDSPADMPNISQQEVAEIGVRSRSHRALPWNVGIRSGNLWGVMTLAASYGYTLYFFQSWFPTFLIKGRGFSETGLLLSSLPFLVGAGANGYGGFLSDALVRRLGLKWGRRSLGLVGLGCAALFMAAAMMTEQKLWSLVFLSLSYGGITIQQPGVLGVCLDIGGKYAGAVTGAMNTATFVAAFLSSVVYGYIVKSYGYDAPFLPMVVLLIISALLWFKVDPTREVISETALAG